MSRVLLINDNRREANWGCRSTSIGLISVLRTSHNVHGTPLSFAQEFHPVGLLPSVAGRRKDELGQIAWRALQSPRLSLLHRAVGGWQDFIGPTPEESVRRFLKHRSSSSELQNFWAELQACDAVVINGEGSFIFRTPRRRDLDFILFIIELAKCVGRPVYFLNAMLSYCPRSEPDLKQVESAVNTLARAEQIRLRDHESVRIASNLGIQGPRFVPDALFAWSILFPEVFKGDLPRPRQLLDSVPEGDLFGSGSQSFPSEFIAVGGASRPPGVSPDNWVPFFKDLAKQLQHESSIGVVLVDTGGDAFLEEVAAGLGMPFIRAATNIFAGAMILGAAKAFVSGRYHPSILAAMGGTQTVYLDSNSHKTRSIQGVLGVSEPRCFGLDVSELPDLVSATVDVVRESDRWNLQLRKTTRELSELAITELTEILLPT